MNLKLTEFSEFEKNKKYELSQFEEMGMVIHILNESTRLHKIPSGNFYKFGVYSNGNYFWYWFGNQVADNREKMREIYRALLQIKKSGDIPFIYKVKRQ
jgi:hypothetical protein